MKERVTVSTKEVSEEVLQQLLESHEKMKQMEEKEADRQEKEATAKLKALDSTSSLLNSGGPMLFMMGVAAVAAAPALLDVAWIWGDLAAAMLVIAGKLSAVAGIGLTGKSAFNRWAVKKRREQMAIITGGPQRLMLSE